MPHEKKKQPPQSGYSKAAITAKTIAATQAPYNCICCTCALNPPSSTHSCPDA